MSVLSHFLRISFCQSYILLSTTQKKRGGGSCTFLKWYSGASTLLNISRVLFTAYSFKVFWTFDVHVTVHRDEFLIINQLDALISQIYWVYSEKTPDDGQRNCPKHVEFPSKINLRN
jgi:hypothetical protein